MWDIYMGTQKMPYKGLYERILSHIAKELHAHQFVVTDLRFQVDLYPKDPDSRGKM